MIGVLNGLVREATYGKHLGEHRAHQVSTLTAIAGLAGYFSGLERRWPIESEREACEPRAQRGWR